MGWGRMDDGFDDHPKVVALLDRDDQAAAGVAVGLWTLCWTWAHRNTRKKGKTPGLIPAGLPRRFLGVAGRQAADLLVEHGLWDTHESGGWMIHDFGDYLPTDETRAARSEAGKRGAAARWGQRASAEDAGVAPDSDGNLPSVCHDPDGSGEATDGSRAPARRDPVPVPEPNTPDRPSDGLFDAPPPATRAATRRPPATKPPAAPPMNLTYTQRSKAITDAYAAAQPLCKWPAVNGVVLKAIKTEQYADDEIHAAVLRLAEEGRSVTVDTLRVELSGLPPGRQGGRAAGYQPFRNDITDDDYEEYMRRGR